MQAFRGEDGFDPTVPVGCWDVASPCAILLSSFPCATLLSSCASWLLCCLSLHSTLILSLHRFFVLRGFHQTMPLPLNAPVTAATAAATAVAAVTATTVVELTIVYCLRKRQQHYHHQRTSSSTNVKRLTSLNDLDLFNISTVFEVCDG